MQTSEVFGISSEILQASYVDRANLDAKIARLMTRNVHIALKGASKSGKTWIRQKCIENANVIQCRLGTTIQDIYVEALANLGFQLEIDRTTNLSAKGRVDISGEIGQKIMVSLKGAAGVELEQNTQSTVRNLRFDLSNLKFIAETLNASGRRLVIEDFHYLSLEERQKFAFDLKALWDYKCFTVIIGIWTQTNLLTSLNGDLTGRIEEVSVLWNDEDLYCVIQKGCNALKIQFSPPILADLVKDSFGNVGILQSLLLRLVDDYAEIPETQPQLVQITDRSLYKKAAVDYAAQLDGTYQQFARSVSNGIRKRKRSTGIYAHALRIILEAPDNEMISGLSRNAIFVVAHEREPRIQTGNLRTVLQKLDSLQVDSAYRGLVVSYDESTDSVFVVDRQLLFYRKHHTMNWPWEEMIEECEQLSLFEADYSL